MKVIVTRCDKNRIIKADMEREIERLFQENKDLRLSEAHLRDELNLSRQQSEVRRQKMVEKDEEIERMRTKIANVGAERDDFEASYKQVLHWWEEAQSKAIKAEERADEYRIALMESDCRVEELEEQLEWARNKNEEWAQIAANQKEEKKALEDVIHTFEATRKEYEEEIHAQHVEKREWMQKYEELKAQKEADDEKGEKICAACNKLYEDIFAERNHLREEVARLTSELETLQNAYNLQKENATINYDTLLVHTKELECKNANLESALNEARANLEAAADSTSCDGELEEQLDHYKKAATIWQEKAEAIQECREKAEAELRDVSNRFIEMYQENVDKENEAREVIADLRDELNDRNTRVEELEKKIEWLQNERQLYENNVARLTNERDTAVKGNAELIEENAELRDNLDAVINIKNEYAETIDEMRKKIVAAQSPEFTAHLAKLIIANLPSTDK